MCSHCNGGTVPNYGLKMRTNGVLPGHWVLEERQMWYVWIQSCGTPLKTHWPERTAGPRLPAQAPGGQSWWRPAPPGQGVRSSAAARRLSSPAQSWGRTAEGCHPALGERERKKRWQGKERGRRSDKEPLSWIRHGFTTSWLCRTTGSNSQYVNTGKKISIAKLTLAIVYAFYNPELQPRAF